MIKVLLLEDDVNLNETIEEFLVEEGFKLSCCFDGQEASSLIYENSYDIFLLDVNVPSPNGFEILKMARDEGTTTPAIYITSLNSMQDVSKGFESGCDDYIRKPFALKELLLRINNIVKRDFYHNDNEKVKIDERFFYDIKADELLDKSKTIPLNNKEKLLLKLFLKHVNEQVSHELIYENLWSFEEEPSDASLRTYIKNLRKILGKDRIVSIKRYGYKFA
ncbi:response regulator transcription factor [Sulfurimonas sp. MAG313]|nr:response regulator transcription factor [Sulfurimonas sp. MAG313]MDF1880880.1 response regulator transcription factor [Sulfurimonas sp. MAG313]